MQCLKIAKPAFLHTPSGSDCLLLWHRKYLMNPATRAKPIKMPITAGTMTAVRSVGTGACEEVVAVASSTIIE